MEEQPVRLACPQCELVYRLKRYTPGKAYSCKNCGGPLTLADNLSPDGDAPAAARPLMQSSFSQPPFSQPQLGQSLFDNSGDVATGRTGIGSGLSPESGLSRLPRLIEELNGRLDVLKQLELSDGESGPAAKLIELNAHLEDDLREFRQAVDSRLSELAEKVTEDLRGGREELDEVRSGLTDLDSRIASSIDEKLREIRLELGDRLGDLHSSFDEKAASSSGVGEGLTSGLEGLSKGLTSGLDSLKDELRRHEEQLAARLEEYRDATKRELGEEFSRELGRQGETHKQGLLDALTQFQEAQKSELQTHHEMQKQAIDALIAPLPGEAHAPTTVEVDIDELADRLVAGLKGSHSKFMDPESGLAMDAMARLADELIKEQNANTARLNTLTEEIKAATAGISKLEEWKGDLPERVADEIGHTVEARVVGPISGALAKQAPSILSDLQDNKLVDIVSRSVREAQRPLLREILSGGRGGIPVWLFASILLPLLLILGYLFLPGEAGHRSNDASAVHIADSLDRIESGLGNPQDNEDRLRTIEEAVLDIHSEALAHVRNAAALEAENKNLKSLLAERDHLMNEYKETLQTQVKRLREYEMRLVQLGVSPKTIGE